MPEEAPNESLLPIGSNHDLLDLGTPKELAQLNQPPPPSKGPLLELWRWIPDSLNVLKNIISTWWFRNEVKNGLNAQTYISTYTRLIQTGMDPKEADKIARSLIRQDASKPKRKR